MLRSMSNLEDYAIHATDGNIGRVKDVYFDDHSWVIRYLVVETGTWLSSRKVLISPIAIGKPNWKERELPVSLNKEQVKNSPDFDTEKPVSRQYEIDYQGYYGYPSYWSGIGLWGDELYPGMLIPNIKEVFSSEHQKGAQTASKTQDNFIQAKDADPHLHSYKSVIDYGITAIDGDVGHVSGMLIDEDTWAARYLIIDTGSWWLGHQALLAPQWIKEMNWIDGTVSINLTRQAVQDAPPYDWTSELNREQERRLHEHYGFAAYSANQVAQNARI